MFLVLRREVLHQLREIVDPRAQHVLFLGVPSPACRKRPFTTHADRLRPRLKSGRLPVAGPAARRAAGVDAGNVYHDFASSVTRRPPGTRQLRARAIVLPGRTTRPVLFAAPLVLARGRRSRRWHMSELSSGELRFIFNTFSFLLCGALVMWMAAGFTMLEAGSVRTKNTAVICLKNIGLYAIAGIAYYVIGYNLMYVDVGSVIGSFTLLRTPSADELALLAGAEGARESVIATDYAVMSDWFFQMVFVATAASIVSGALAERVKLWSFFVFTLVLTAFIYPIVGAWTWGGGWLNQMGFQDFAGSTIVHSTGGAAALAGALIVGPRHTTSSATMAASRSRRRPTCRW